MIPRATVRLQLTREFGFDAARDCIDYYAALGISHYYLSPVFRARAGSTHGYDTMDFSEVSDELGGAAGLARLANALHQRGMGILLDIVPNHMGVAGPDNAWWNDVLAHGRASAFAGHFDIDWTPADPELRGRVLLPVLDAPLAEVIGAGRIGVVRDAGDGRLWVAFHAARWPLAPEGPADAGGVDSAGPARLDALLERQHYRLDHWRRAADRINWRRFFDISELAALRVEDERVFADVHEGIFALFQSGTIDGVRVDHVDGLADPLDYCRRLRAGLEALAPGRPPERRDAAVYIVVEKVFAAHEPARDWGVAGTTGYDFMDQAGAWLHNPAGQPVLDILWRDTSGRPWEFRPAVAQARREVLLASFRADLARATRAFHAVARHAPSAAALAYAALERALTELVVAFPVYRCYGLPGALPPEDAAILATALERANRELAADDYPALDFLARCLRDAPAPGDDAVQRDAAVRFQQLTAAIAARAIEDTVFYREARLLSRNEVGSDPNVFSIGTDEFHAACQARALRFPHGLLATATHDHKRGEDVRARLAVLSDDAAAWAAAVARWREINAAQRETGPATTQRPDPIDELMLYQMLAGAWPLIAPSGTPAREALRERFAQWWRKALREAKRHTSWTAPDETYEAACLDFLAAILDMDDPPPGDGSAGEAAGRGTNFAGELQAYVDRIAAAGALNALTQTFLRLTTPGVPDLYQGCELWDFSLVDPDNRRPVDYDERRNALAPHLSLTDALGRWRDGTVKQRLIARILQHRRVHERLYADGEYRPLTICGAHAAHAIAFERRGDAGRLLCIASRWPLSLAGGELPQPHVAPELWQDTWIDVEPGVTFANVLHDDAEPIVHGSVRLADALARFPAGLYFSAA